MRTLLSALFCLSFLVLSAQRQDANWVFGYHCGMYFDANGGISNYPTALNTFEAAASISDSAGNLLFYAGPTNPADFYSPFTIFSQDGNSINNGDSISLIATSTNGAVFLEIIQDSVYFLIHTGLDLITSNNLGSACYKLYITRIEWQNQGWTVPYKNRLLSSRLVNEKIAATPHGNGKDWWIIAQSHLANEDSLCTNEYLVVRALNDSVVSKTERIGRSWCSQASFGGELVFSGQGNKLAVATRGDYFIRYFDFDRCSGTLLNYGDIILQNSGIPYSVEFSPNENLLYVSYGGGIAPQGLAQINFYNGQNSQAVIWDYSFQGFLGQLQYAPDGKIYLSSGLTNYIVDDTLNKYLTVITEPDNIGPACNLSVLSYHVGDSCRTRGGLPNMPNYNLGPLPIYMADAGMDTFYCAGDETIKALPIGGDSIYGITYQWQPAPGIDTLTNRTQLVLPPAQSRWYYVTLTDTNYVGPSCNIRVDSVYVEVRNCDTVGITETTTLQAHLYPNPTTGTLTVALPNGQGGSIALYNLLGQSVYQSPLNGSQTTVDINLLPGIYLYRISSGGKAVNGKLLVE